MDKTLPLSEASHEDIIQQAEQRADSKAINRAEDASREVWFYNIFLFYFSISSAVQPYLAPLEKLVTYEGLPDH